jgi:hypothetical protein
MDRHVYETITHIWSCVLFSITEISRILRIDLTTPGALRLVNYTGSLVSPAGTGLRCSVATDIYMFEVKVTSFNCTFLSVMKSPVESPIPFLFFSFRPALYCSEVQYRAHRIKMGWWYFRDTTEAFLGRNRLDACRNVKRNESFMYQNTFITKIQNEWITKVELCELQSDLVEYWVLSVWL